MAKNTFCKRRKLRVLLLFFALLALQMNLQAYFVPNHVMAETQTKALAAKTIFAPIKDVFPDEALAKIIANKLHKNVTDEVSDEELEKVMILDAENENVKNLTGMQYLTGMEFLYLHNNQISDLRPLSGLTKLRALTLQTNQISDISPLSNLTELRILHLDNNKKISDVSPLLGLTKLNELYLFSNQIKDVSPLSGLTALTRLDLDHNQISDISPLSGLTALQRSDLDHNQISDISPLSGLTELKSLRLQNNQISDVSPLSSLSKLTSLNATNQSIQLKPGTIGIPTPFALYNRDGSVPQMNWKKGTGKLENGSITWETPGENELTWSGTSFSGTAKQTVQDGTLSLLAPDSISFGDNVKISPKHERYPIQGMNKKLGVQDTRGNKARWSLTASLVEPLKHSDGSELPNAIVYRLNNKDSILSSSSTVIYENKNSDGQPFFVSNVWDKTGDGLFLDIQAGQAKVGQYTATIRWVLEDTPEH
ncbi:leucine-rich repeat domain-containing protein [Paenibacillus larvae]